MRIFVSLILCSLTILSACSPEDPAIAWKAKTDGRILSHPVTMAGIVYFGNDNGTFYAVDQANGHERWSYQSDHRAGGTALITEAIVVFVSGNNVHALQTGTGEELWTYRNPDPRGAEQIDPWDYHAGSLVLDGSRVYAGLGNGTVMGFELTTGDVISQIPAIDAAPVRSGLLVQDGTLFFGDWNGRVYAYDLETGEMNWSVQTYEERPYQTFGALTAGFAVHGDLLFFGARNTELQALDKKTGDVRWSYIEETGGWISGDPIVEDGILYIAGSDNHELFAFDASTGEKLWTFEFTFNNFSRPLIHGDAIFLTTGDAYSVYGSGVGRGFLYTLNKRDGSLRDVRIMGGNSYSSPVMADDLVIVGSEDSSVYAFDVSHLLQGPFDPAEIGYDAIRIGEIDPQPLVTDASITYTVSYPAYVSVEITTLADSVIRHLSSGEMPEGTHTAVWDGTDDNGHSANDGYYFVKAGSKDFYRTAFIQKKTSQ